MRFPPFQYLSPRTTEEALEIMSRYKGKVRIIAGGTDIMNLLRQRLLSPQYAMTLKGVSDLRGIKSKKGHFLISAATTLREIVESPDIAGFAAAIARVGRSCGRPSDPERRNRWGQSPAKHPVPLLQPV